MKIIEPPPRPAKPFLKWAGRKNCLLGHLTEFVLLKYNRYCEAFVGGGAFFFHLAPQAAVLADANFELIHCFRAPASFIPAFRFKSCRWRINCMTNKDKSVNLSL